MIAHTLILVARTRVSGFSSWPFSASWMNVVALEVVLADGLAILVDMSRKLGRTTRKFTSLLSLIAVGSNRRLSCTMKRYWWPQLIASIIQSIPKYYAIWPCEIRWDDMRVIKQLGTVGMIPAVPRDFKTLDSLDSFWPLWLHFQQAVYIRTYI